MVDVKAICVAYKFSSEIEKKELAGMDFFDNLHTSK
jgi:hypothetical protein